MPITSDDIRTLNHHNNNKLDRYSIEDLIKAYDKNRDYFGHEDITEKEIIDIHKKFVSDFPPKKNVYIRYR